jgi:hypothetical protein
MAPATAPCGIVPEPQSPTTKRSPTGPATEVVVAVVGVVVVLVAGVVADVVVVGAVVVVGSLAGSVPHAVRRPRISPIVMKFLAREPVTASAYAG